MMNRFSNTVIIIFIRFFKYNAKVIETKGDI